MIATLISNTGVTLKTDSLNIMVDGLYEIDNQCISNIDERTRQKLELNEEPYGKIDTALITHYHQDHFSFSMMVNFLKTRDDSMKVFYPFPMGEYGGGFLERENPDFKGVDTGIFKPSKKICYDDGTTKIRSKSMRHLGPKSKIRNMCYSVEENGRGVIFIADATYDGELADMKNGLRELSAIFVTPLFFNNYRGREILKEMNPQKVVIYHLPFEEDDNCNFNFIASKDAEKYGNEFKELLLLNEREQQVII